MTEQKKDDRTKENKNKKRTTNLFTNKDKREMKTRTLFVTALLGLGMMASCSNDELEGDCTQRSKLGCNQSNDRRP